MDPVIQVALTIIASAFGGVIITVLAGFVTFALTGQREQKKWLLDLKYKAYTARLEAIEETGRNLAQIARGRITPDTSTPIPSTQEVSFLASKDVEDKYLLWSRSYSNYVDIVQLRMKAIGKELSDATPEERKSLKAKYHEGDGPLAYEFRSLESITNSCAAILATAMKKDVGLKVDWRTRRKLRKAKASIIPSTRAELPKPPLDKNETPTVKLGS
jgi:hypothetical protein